MTVGRDGNDSLAALRRRIAEAPADVAAAEVLEHLDTLDRDRCEDVIEPLVTLLAASPDETDASVTSLESRLTDDRVEIRFGAAIAIQRLAEDDAEVVASVAPSLVDALDDDYPSIRRDAATALLTIARDCPAAVEPVVPKLAPHFQADRPAVADAVLEIVLEVVQERPEAVRDIVTELLALVTSESGDLSATDVEALAEGPGREQILEKERRARLRAHVRRRRAAAILVGLAVQDPDAVEPHFSVVLDAYDAVEKEAIRSDLLDVIGSVAERTPAAATAAIELLAREVGGSGSVAVRAKAAWILGILADEFPAEVAADIVPQIHAVVELLEGDDARTRGAAIGLLSYVAEENPVAVEPVRNQVQSLLTDEDESVRGNAVWTLHFIGPRESHEQLSELAKNDSSPAVREAATNVLDATNRSRDTG